MKQNSLLYIIPLLIVLMFPLVLSIHILKTNTIAAITLFSMTFFLFVACLQQLFPHVFNKKKNRMYWIHKLIDKIDTFYVILFFLMGAIGLMVKYFL